MEKKNKEQIREVPLGVKIISILYYIGAVLCLLFGLIIIISSNAMASSLVASNPGLGLESIPHGTLITMIIVIGAILIGASIFAFFIGRGIRRLRKWARITAIILAILGLISAIFSIIIGFKFTQIISLLIDGFIGGYLLFSKEAKEVFKK
jgi:lysylphosphatidylglycerol synthetase-like protein (DUF2156 family)